MSHIDDELLNEYLDGELDRTLFGQVEAHLAGCDLCRERMMKMRQLFASLDELPEVALGVDLSQRVAARLSAEFRPRPVPRWTFAVLVLQLVMALTFFLWLWPAVEPLLETAGQTLLEVIDQLMLEISTSEPVLFTADGLESLREMGEAVGLDGSLPVAEGLLIIGLALILWLAGSGLLLKQSLMVQQKS